MLILLLCRVVCIPPAQCLTKVTFLFTTSFSFSTGTYWQLQATQTGTTQSITLTRLILIIHSLHAESTHQQISITHRVSKPDTTDGREITRVSSLHAFYNTWILIETYSYVFLFVGARLASAVEPKVE